MTLRRGLVTTAMALCAVAAVPAAAARLPVADRGLAAGAAAVARCDTSVAATTVVAGTTVTDVSVADLDAACAGATLTVTAAGSAGAALGAGSSTVPPGGGTVVVALSPQPSATEVTDLRIVAQGAAGAPSPNRLGVASASLSTFGTGVTPASGLLLALANGASSTAGSPGRSDTVTVTFPRAVNPTSICSAWTVAPHVVRSRDVVVTITNGAGTANDVLTVAVGAADCPTFRFGTVDLGGPAYVGATTTFSATGNNDRSEVAYDPATRALRVTLGLASGPTQTSPATIATFTPAAGLQYTTAPTAVTGTATTASQVQL